MGKKANRNRHYTQDEQYQENYNKDELKRKKFHIKDLCNFQGRSDNQHRFIEHWFSEKSNIFLLTGYPGTGKTFQALRAAFDDVLEPDLPYEKVIIFRSAVDTRETGFKSGDEKQKDDVYSAPYRALVHDVFNLGYSDLYENLEELGLLTFKTSSNQRGMTYNNAILVFDEIQNMNYSELRTLFSRKGKNSKVIMCGDLGQNDLVRKSNDKSGLEDWIKVVHKMGYPIHIKFDSLDDIVRDDDIANMIKAEIELGFV